MPDAGHVPASHVHVPADAEGEIALAHETAGDLLHQALGLIAPHVRIRRME